MLLKLLAAVVLPRLAIGRLGTQFFNPILPGFHPDPSCVFVAEEEVVYCATSSFSVFPGIPIHASRDLVNWKLVGNVLNRESQLPELASINGSRSGIWAPTLRHHNGTFYLVTTLVHDDKAREDTTRWDNIIFSTPDIWDDSKWTDAVHFDFGGYDTSPFWDDEGNEYIVGSHDWRLAYGTHLNKVDFRTGELKGNWTNLWNGTGGLAPEGPHIYKKDGYYYLLLAEGGTGVGHMVTFARSKNLYGPYDPNPSNPVLTNANTTEYFQTVGHADLFQDARGNWWAVALATRSGPEYRTYPMGRETILTNVTWANGSWPVFNNPVRGSMEGWELPVSNQSLPGNGAFVDEGDENLQFPPNSSLPLHFVHWRPPVAENYAISPPGHPNSLRLKPSKLNLTGIDGSAGGEGRQTFVGRRQVDTLFTYRVDIEYNPKTIEEEAGITLFLTQKNHARFGLTLLPSGSANTLLTPHFRFHAISHLPVPSAFSVPVPPSFLAANTTNFAFELKTVNATHYSFAAGPPNSKAPLTVFAYVGGDIVSRDFTGTLVGVYATSNGGNGTEAAYVRNWNYEGWGQVRDNLNGTLGVEG